MEREDTYEFPARAGMNRTSTNSAAFPIRVPRTQSRQYHPGSGVPRTRGDEP